MQIEPSAGVFAASYARGATQVVWTTLVADLDTPVSAFLKTGADKKLSFLLESVEGGAVRGRYSIIGLDPDVVWRARGTRAEINRAARTEPQAFAPCAEPPLRRTRLVTEPARHAGPLPPMAAGVSAISATTWSADGGTGAQSDPIGIPDAILVRPTVVIIFDSVLDTITLVTPVRPAAGVTAERALGRAVERLTAGGRRPSTGRSRASRARPRGGARCPRHLEHHAAGIPRHGAGRRNTSRPATSSRWCWRSAEATFTLPAFALYRRCAGSIRRRSCPISTMTASPSPAPARKSLCAPAATP
jgi:hypothetical protein